MTTQTEALKPCPFCGGEAELIIDNDHHGEFFQLGCKDKKCLGHWAYYTESIAETPVSEAIAHWNTRALAQQSNEQSKCNHTKTITRADIDGNQIETTCGECGERVAQQSDEQVERVAWTDKAFERLCENWNHMTSEEFAIVQRFIFGVYAHPPVPTAQPKEPEQKPVAWKLVPVKPTREIEDAIGNSRNLKASEIWEDALAAISTPPPVAEPHKRTWVGLTHSDIDQGLLRSDYAFNTAEAWRAGVVFAMTKLKEKNQ